MTDRIADPCGTRAPARPARVDTYLEPGVSEVKQRRVRSASASFSNGDALDVAVQARRRRVRRTPAQVEVATPSPWHDDSGRGLVWVLGGIGVIIVLLLGIAVIGERRDWLPSLSNPFAEETTDLSQPVLLRSIQDLSRFTAASGDFQVIIDVETNRRFIPDVILGERTLFVAAGTVDAYVEFGGLAGDALVVDQAQSAVAVTLPIPELAPPNIDHDRSYVFAQQRGVADRISEIFGGEPDQHQQILRLAERRIAEAAEASELRTRAADNTRRMLEGMFGSLGFERVTVDFVSS
jgi:hypothetical protein